ncbi:unnamed protein product [Prorocentrum cordatum]|uniref:Uncharacterized protein n=1 Tax=Prorocentrum cordatum TaxID=2364126 RepID=A0ABN9RU29_9DINO|nr:unnamed protein product [Polarella glacialis]
MRRARDAAAAWRAGFRGRRSGRGLRHTDPAPLVGRLPGQRPPRPTPAPTPGGVQAGGGSEVAKGSAPPTAAAAAAAPLQLAALVGRSPDPRPQGRAGPRAVPLGPERPAASGGGDCEDDSDVGPERSVGPAGCGAAAPTGDIQEGSLIVGEAEKGDGRGSCEMPGPWAAGVASGPAQREADGFGSQSHLDSEALNEGSRGAVAPRSWGATLAANSRRIRGPSRCSSTAGPSSSSSATRSTRRRRRPPGRRPRSRRPRVGRRRGRSRRSAPQLGR